MEGTGDEVDASMPSTSKMDEHPPPRAPPGKTSKDNAPELLAPPLLKSRSVPTPVNPSGAASSSLSVPTSGLMIDNPSPRPEPSSEPALHVLVVDDDSLTRTLMTRMLTRLGCVVETASDGQQALDLLLGNTAPDATISNEPRFFDLISLDNAMPVLTGQDAVKRLRELGRTDFVVGYVSAFGPLNDMLTVSCL